MASAEKSLAEYSNSCFSFDVALRLGFRPSTQINELKWSNLPIHDDAETPHVPVPVPKVSQHYTPAHIIAAPSHHDGHHFRHAETRSQDSKDTDPHVPDNYDPLHVQAYLLVAQQKGRRFFCLCSRLFDWIDPQEEHERCTHFDTPTSRNVARRGKHQWIAKQCRTSAAMIHLHYDHIIAVMHAKGLVGSENAALTKLIQQYADLA